MLRAVDLWRLQRLSAHGDADARTIRWDRGLQLVSAPIPLMGRRLGLLLRTGNEHRWSIWDLEKELLENAAQLVRRWKAAPVVKIDGESVDCFRLGEPLVAIESTLGHWVLPVAATETESVSGLRLTCSLGATASNVGRSVIEPGDRWWRLRSILPRVVDGRQIGVEWFYRVSYQDRSGGHVERYRLMFDGSLPEKPQFLRESDGLKPVGVEAVGGSEQPIFLSSRWEFLRLIGASGRLEQCGVTLPQIPNSLFVGGHMFLALGNAAVGRHAAWFGTLGPERWALLADNAGFPHADPLLWSRWCFTVERDQDSRLMLLRRDLELDAG
jgi:hypothetical protein